MSLLNVMHKVIGTALVGASLTGLGLVGYGIFSIAVLKPRARAAELAATTAGNPIAVASSDSPAQLK
jgi:hypothetical protein